MGLYLDSATTIALQDYNLKTLTRIRYDRAKFLENVTTVILKLNFRIWHDRSYGVNKKIFKFSS